jgi:hypothetical protein
VNKQDGGRGRWDRDVVAGGAIQRHLNMASFWSQLGVVVFDKGSGKFVETERTFKSLTS